MGRRIWLRHRLAACASALCLAALVSILVGALPVRLDAPVAVSALAVACCAAVDRGRRRNRMCTASRMREASYAAQALETFLEIDGKLPRPTDDGPVPGPRPTFHAGIHRDEPAVVVRGLTCPPLPRTYGGFPVIMKRPYSARES